MIKDLQFDSGLAGCRVGELSLGETSALSLVGLASDIGDYDLVYLKTGMRQDLNLLLDGFDWILADVKIEFSRNIGEVGYKPLALAPEDFYTKSDIEEVVRLGKDLYKASRFYFDPNTRGLGQKIYEEWINNSINKTLADEIVVCRDGRGKVIGFVTVKICPEFAEAVLAKVDPSHAGKGYGKILMNKCYNYIARNDLDAKVIAHTQIKNNVALRLHQSFGLRMEDYGFVYHIYPKGFREI